MSMKDVNIETLSGPVRIVDNSKANQTVVMIGITEIFFSYHVPIAFYNHELGLVVNGEKYSPTTSKHLNRIKETFNGGLVLPFDRFIDALSRYVCLK